MKVVLELDEIGQLKFHSVDTDRILQALSDVAAGVLTLHSEVEILRSQGVSLMATAAEIQAQVTAVREGVAAIGPSLADIAADIDRIKAQIVGGITADEATAIQNQLATVQDAVTSVVTAARTLAESNPNP
jgi:prefoldin subunit 5